MIRNFFYGSRVGLVALFTLMIAVSTAVADKDKNPRSISLTGVGEISASPDIARITSGVVSQAKTAAKALRANSAAMTKIIKALKVAKISAKDIQTSGFSVNPTYYYDQKNRRNPPKIIGYQVRNQVRITVRQRDRLGGILDQMISLGANQINGISFAIDKPRKLLDEARKLAIKDARRKADLYMVATNSKLGRIISISENQAYQPTPKFAQRAVAYQSEAAVPVEAGEHSLRIQVNIVWELE